jgi:hypothetical protein
VLATLDESLLKPISHGRSHHCHTIDLISDRLRSKARTVTVTDFSRLHQTHALIFTIQDDVDIAMLNALEDAAEEDGYFRRRHMPCIVAANAIGSQGQTGFRPIR